MTLIPRSDKKRVYAILSFVPAFALYLVLQAYMYIVNLRFLADVVLFVGIIAADPFAVPPPYESLVGNLQGAISRRINILHRLVYQVLESEQVVKVLRMWTHYE